MAIVQVVNLVTAFTGGPAAARSGGGAMASLGCILGILGLAMIVLAIMYLLMIEKMGRRFKEQARAARNSWAAGAFTPRTV
jgi:hypothetical protein